MRQCVYKSLANHSISCRLKVIEERNVTIEHVLVNNPACPECINKLNDDTLCFKMYLNDTKNTTRIGCLINEGLVEHNNFQIIYVIIIEINLLVKLYVTY